MHINVRVLRGLYSGLNNLYWAYDVVQKLLRGHKGIKPLSQHYVVFKTAFEELTLFCISTYARKKQT